MKMKKMPEEEFLEILGRKWIPLQLIGDAIPTFLKNIPNDKLHSVYASGGPYTDIVHTGGAILPGELIGGIDVYRNSPDDPVELNKDWYAVIRTTVDERIYLVAGPYKDNEHWINNIPLRLNSVEILGVPPNPIRYDQKDPDDT